MGLRRRIKAALLLLASALTLTGTAAADFAPDFTAESLDAVIERYMDEHGLDESNFAMGWYDFASGEEWFFNGDSFMVAGSMYKLPLNMAYTDKLASGDVSADDMVGKYTVERAMELSIVYSDNDAADALTDGLRLRQREYRSMLAQYSGISESGLPEEYFTDNCISARFMINTLVYLYDNSGLYSALIEHMKSAHPGRFFRKTEGEYEIAHKYGYFEGGLDDCGIVYSPRPFALVVFTRKVRDGEAVLGELCALMTDYSLYLDSLPEPDRPDALSAAAEPEPERVPETSAVPEPGTASPEVEETRRAEDTDVFRPAFAGICAVLLCLAGVRHMAAKKRRKAAKGGRGN